MEPEATLTRERLVAAAAAWAALEAALGPIDLSFGDTMGARMMDALDHLLELQAGGKETPPEGLARLACFVTEWVEQYDERVAPKQVIAPVDLLRHLMDANNLRQRDLAPLMGGQSVVSLVLRGLRPINLKQARALAAHFSMKVSAFFPDVDVIAPREVVSVSSGPTFHVFDSVSDARVVASAAYEYADASTICH